MIRIGNKIVLHEDDLLEIRELIRRAHAYDAAHNWDEEEITYRALGWAVEELIEELDKV